MKFRFALLSACLAAGAHTRPSPIRSAGTSQPFFAYISTGYIWGYSDTVSFAKGRHFFKAGYENQNYFSTIRYPAGNSGLSLTFNNATTNIPGLWLALR